MNQPTAWYQDGLRFACTGCGKCCEGPKGGVVWVNLRECRAMARHLGMKLTTFLRKHTRRLLGRRTLRETRSGGCVLYDAEAKSCTVFAVQPRQCVSFPFWPSTTGDVEDWVECARRCEGVGQGELISAEEITRRIRMVRI